MWRTRSRFLASEYRSIPCILFLVCLLLINQRWNHADRDTVNPQTDARPFIDRIRAIAILEQNLVFTVAHTVTSNVVPQWLHHYGVTHLFNFYWLQNGAYLWHRQRLIDMKQDSNDIEPRFKQVFPENFQATHMFDYLHHHPEHGIILDTAPDPVKQLFSPLPRSSSSLEETCEHYPWLKHWYPCQTRSEMLPSTVVPSPITYALYDVTITTRSSTLNTVDYEEVIYLFDSQRQLTNETFFVRQTLPRLIRLLALAPQTTLILLPYANTQAYIRLYLDVLVARGLVTDDKRFLEYNASEIYHTNVLYSTSSPRSDLLLLQRVLAGNQTSIRPELILIIRNNLDDFSYEEITQTISLFEFPDDLNYMRVQEYHEDAHNLTLISDLFRRARIVIGTPTNVLSHIVWCQPRTHIIEIIQKTMTTDFYEMSVELGLNYWLAKTTTTNLIDVIDFRNLMMQVLGNMDA